MIQDRISARLSMKWAVYSFRVIQEPSTCKVSRLLVTTWTHYYSFVSSTGQPSFREPLRSITASLGSQAVFHCLVVSNPPATVSWTHGQQNLSNGGRVFLNSSALIISSVQSSDEGYYYCNAQNSFGVNSTSAALTIGGKKCNNGSLAAWQLYCFRKIIGEEKTKVEQKHQVIMVQNNYAEKRGKVSDHDVT